jgi:hypothetical protein
MAWAVALVLTVTFLASAAASMAGAVENAGVSGERANSTAAPDGYFVDTLFRSDHPAAENNSGSSQIDTERILSHALRQPGCRSDVGRGPLRKVVCEGHGSHAADVTDRFQPLQSGQLEICGAFHVAASKPPAKSGTFLALHVPVRSDMPETWTVALHDRGESA